MALPTSGPLTLANIQTEFGGSNPISLNEYYAGGANVPAGTSGTNGAVPSSGQISISSFYGTSAAPLASYSLTTGSTGSVGFRYRGYDDGSFTGTAIGSLSPTAFTLNGGSVIEALLYDEDALLYTLQVSGGTNSGWTSMNIGGTLTLTRASATYTSSVGNSYWQWATSDTIATQAFGGLGAVRTINFY